MARVPTITSDPLIAAGLNDRDLNNAPRHYQKLVMESTISGTVAYSHPNSGSGSSGSMVTYTSTYSGTITRTYTRITDERYLESLAYLYSTEDPQYPYPGGDSSRYSLDCFGYQPSDADHSGYLFGVGYTTGVYLDISWGNSGPSGPFAPTPSVGGYSVRLTTVGRVDSQGGALPDLDATYDIGIAPLLFLWAPRFVAPGGGPGPSARAKATKWEAPIMSPTLLASLRLKSPADGLHTVDASAWSARKWRDYRGGYTATDVVFESYPPGMVGGSSAGTVTEKMKWTLS